MMKSRIGSWVVAACLAGVALAPFSEADAALNAYLKLKGQKSGDIKGSVTQKGREGRIAVIAVSHSIVSPRDAASGLPTGKRMHKPFVITKRIDRSTPTLNGMLVSNENLSEASFSVYEPDLKSGAEVLVYTVKLTNANIASIELRTDTDGKLVEEITLVYQKIEWVWADGGVSNSDSWGGAGN
jgi:type VI secretion system secreted protein Hcp